jgi:Protein of unknown function (DUF1552)
MEQEADRAEGHLTPLPSLELATDPVVNGLDRAVNYTRMYGSYISWRLPNLPLPQLIDPRAVFGRMFGPRDAAGRPLPQPSSADDRSLLDAALKSAHDLRARLGRSDQHKLDDYLESAKRDKGWDFIITLSVSPDERRVDLFMQTNQKSRPRPPCWPLKSSSGCHRAGY